MLNRLMNMALGAVIGQLLKQKVRNSSIQAVKAYIQLVKGARAVAMALVAIGAVAAVIVAGVILTVVGLVGLLPIEPNTVALIILCIGVVMTLTASFFVYGAFREKHWLEMSKAYDMMDVALAPWNGILPPNPMDVLKGNVQVPPAPTADELRSAREVELTRRQNVDVLPRFTRDEFAPTI